MPQAYTVYTVASSAASLVFCMLLLILYWKNEEIRREKEGEMMKFLSRLWNVQNIVLVLSWNNEMEERVFGVS